LLMSEEKAKELGYKPWAYLRDWSFQACDPWEELLLGEYYPHYRFLSRHC
jgi:acetyl-CoA acetyltransferase